MSDENQRFGTFIHIMKYINGRYYSNFSTKSTVRLRATVWYIQIDVSYEEERNKYYIEVNTSQLKEFLLIIYYNQLILIL